MIIEATGLPLGLFDEADYDEFRFKMKPGDMFVFFSDGILDARNRSGELFGRGRVEKIIAGMRGQIGRLRGRFSLQSCSRAFRWSRDLR